MTKVALAVPATLAEAVAQAWLLEERAAYEAAVTKVAPLGSQEDRLAEVRAIVDAAARFADDTPSPIAAMIERLARVVEAEMVAGDLSGLVG